MTFICWELTMPHKLGSPVYHANKLPYLVFVKNTLSVFLKETLYTCSCLTCRLIRIQFNITRVKQTWKLWYNIVFIDINMKKKWNLIVELNVYMYIHHKKWSTRGQHHHLSYNSHIKLNELMSTPRNHDLNKLQFTLSDDVSLITTFLGKWFLRKRFL